MPSVEDYQKFLNGDLSADELKGRQGALQSENPLVDWDAHDRATGMYDRQRSYNTHVGQSEDMRLHDRSKGGGTSVGDYEAFFEGKMSVTDLRTRVASGYDPVDDMSNYDRASGLYDDQRGLATTYGLEREQLDHDVATGRFDRQRTTDVPGPTATVDPVDDQLRHDIANGRFDTPSYNDYAAYNNSPVDPFRR